VAEAAHPLRQSFSLPRLMSPGAPAPPVVTAPPANHSTTDVCLDLQPTVAAHVEETTSVETLTPELQLAVAFELLHRFNMAKKSRSLSAEELDLIDFLVAQVALLSSSLEVACDAVVAESLAIPLVASEAMESGIVASSTTPPRSWMHRLSSSGRRLPLWWPWSCRPLASWSPSRRGLRTSLP
jgi:hypothetical protein